MHGRGSAFCVSPHRRSTVKGHYAIVVIRSGEVVINTPNIVAAATCWDPGTCWGGGDTPIQAAADAKEKAKVFRSLKGD